jgi:hypothetical protein
MGGFNPSFNYVLPKPLATATSLPGYAKGNGEIGGNRKEIQAAPTPEAQFDIPISKHEKSEAQGSTIGAQRKQRKAEHSERNKLETSLGDNIDPQTRKLLASFLKNYEKED